MVVIKLRGLLSRIFIFLPFVEKMLFYVILMLHLTFAVNFVLLQEAIVGLIAVDVIV